MGVILIVGITPVIVVIYFLRLWCLKQAGNPEQAGFVFALAMWVLVLVQVTAVLSYL